MGGLEGVRERKWNRGGGGRTAQSVCGGWGTVGVKSHTVEMIEKNSSGSLVQGVIAWASTFQIITRSHLTDS